MTEIVGIGRDDDTPIVSAIAMRGITLRPLAPVHPKANNLADGSLSLRWTRRGRGAFQWSDGVDVPLREQSESYLVSFGSATSSLAVWEVAFPELLIPAGTLAELSGMLPDGAFFVSQRGSYALSERLLLATLS